MENSLQHFYSTTAKMLNKEEPPSSTFCISGEKNEEVRYNQAGDIIASMFIVCLENDDFSIEFDALCGIL